MQQFVDVLLLVQPADEQDRAVFVGQAGAEPGHVDTARHRDGAATETVIPQHGHRDRGGRGDHGRVCVHPRQIPPRHAGRRSA
jgi:hypothetical protein